MSYLAATPIDEIARDGAHHTFIADDESQHCARWDARRGLYLYNDEWCVERPLVAYLARLPGLPPEERTA